MAHFPARAHDTELNSRHNKMQKRVHYLRHPVDQAKRAASLQLIKDIESQTIPVWRREVDYSKCQLQSYPGEYEIDKDPKS